MHHSRSNGSLKRTQRSKLINKNQRIKNPQWKRMRLWTNNNRIIKHIYNRLSMVVIHSLRLCRVLRQGLKEVLLPWPPSAYKTCITPEMVSSQLKQETKPDSYPRQPPKLVHLKHKTQLRVLQRMTTTLSTRAVLTYRSIMIRSSRSQGD